MIDRLDKKYCTGCFACAQKCPKQCISVIQDEEGFYIPSIDRMQCIHCDLCERSCPQMRLIDLHSCRSAYAARIKDDALLKKSSSGGVFAVLAKYALQQGGVVFGAIMDCEGNVKTVGITDETDLPKLQGSKYVQSFVGNTYKEAKTFLDTGRLVLFSGTPCQIAGLYGYLGKLYDNLLTMDLVCHGVPSQLVFSKYRDWMERKKKKRILSWDFRCKEPEGWAQIDKVTYEGKTEYQREYLSPYTRAYLNCILNRESCYSCNYSCEERIGDITAGDYWGIRCIHPEFYSQKGVSLLLVNTVKGEQVLKAIMHEIELLPSDLESMKRYNGNLAAPSMRPAQRDTVYKNLRRKPIAEFVNLDLAVPFDLKERLKKWIPYSSRQKIKKCLSPLRIRK